MSSVVRLHMMSTGMMESPLGGFLEGEVGTLRYPVPVFVIEHPRGLVAVDAGLHPDLSTGSERLGPLDGPFRVQLPSDGTGTVGAQFASAGFDPAEIRHVIVTHLHFDHVGGLVELPNARIVVQSAEWAARNDELLVSAGAYNPDDIASGHDRVEIKGDHDLFGDGTITCLLTDGHTAGHQSVRVRTEAGTFVICGDCCYLRRTLLNEHLPPFGVNRERQLAAVRRMARERADGAALIFGHDSEQWETIAQAGLSTTI